jgi:8-amino-3,8-dideoxy-alpha-D-manno-octulosonate transaminase
MRKGIYKVREFESKLSEKFSVPHAQAVSSGSAALRVALATLDIGPGDEVIIPAFTFVATAEAVIQSGANLVIVNIDDTFNMDSSSFEAAITERTKAVIPVHMMGAPADMASISSVAARHNIKVIEDACQCVGGTYRGKNLGTLGDIGCYSFDAGKVIITGEGGMVVTNNRDFFVKARAYHDHGHEYSTAVGRGEEGAIGEGFNYRMTEIHGAIGIAQLAKLDMILSKQRANKAKLKSILTENKFPFKFRRVVDEGEIGDSLLFMLNDRLQTQAFLTAMKREGLSTKNVPDSMRWHFAKHWSHMFKKYGWYKETHQTEWQQSADILETAIAIPIMIKMTDERIEEIAEKLLSIAAEVN